MDWARAAADALGAWLQSLGLVTRDWVEISIAVATLLLAVATFLLARYAKAEVADGRATIEQIRLQTAALTQQAAAIDRQAKATEQQVADARKHELQRGRVFIEWIEPEDKESGVWYSDDEGELSLPARVRNHGPAIAFLNGAESTDPSQVRVTTFTDWLQPGAESEAWIRIKCKLDTPIDLSADLIARATSAVSGEQRTTKAMFHIEGRVVAAPDGEAQLLKPFAGFWYLVPTSQPPPSS